MGAPSRPVTVPNVLCNTVPSFSPITDNRRHGNSYLWDAQPVVCLLHGLTSVVHWFGAIPLIPVRTQACRDTSCELRASTLTVIEVSVSLKTEVRISRKLVPYSA